MKLELKVPAADIDIINLIISKIKDSRSAFVTMHARPDGDAIGSALALYNILKKEGLDVEIISPDPVMVASSRSSAHT